ncbi:MAG: winged helix DNA-binding protein [Chloroflexi bacterium]|nr:winged helix DNA-binding protein [Chloroflexota bacterium]
MRGKVARDDRMRALVEAIAEHGAVHGYPPTVRDLQKRTRASSTSVVAYRLAACERAGLVMRVPERARAITLTAEGRAFAASHTEERPTAAQARQVAAA